MKLSTLLILGVTAVVLFVGAITFRECTSPTKVESTPVTQYCNIRIVTDSTFEGTDDCWVVEVCGNGESFESLYKGDNMMECVDWIDNRAGD